MTISRKFLAAVFILAAVHVSNATEVKAIVATRTIYPGQLVAADQVASLGLAECTGCKPGYVVDESLIIGKIANRTILPNRLIYPEAFRSPAIIKKGATTNLIYRSGSLAISVKAIALNDAAVGEPVAVRTLLNGSTLTGTTQNDGSVLAGGS